MKSALGALTFKNGFGDHRRIAGGAPWGNFWTTLRLFWVPKIGPKAHWINVEGVYAQSLVSNTPYIVLKDFGVQRPPQIGLKSIKNRSQIGLESEFVSKSLSKSILEGCRVDFGTNFGSEMGGVLLSRWCLEAVRGPNWTPKAVWTLLRTILEAFWKHF